MHTICCKCQGSGVQLSSECRGRHRHAPTGAVLPVPGLGPLAVCVQCPDLCSTLHLLYCATRHNQWPRFSYIGPVNCSDVTLENRVTLNRGTGCNIVSAWDLISFLDNVYRIST